MSAMVIRTVPVGECVEPIQTWNPVRDCKDETFRYIDISSVSQDDKRITLNGGVLTSEAPSRARQLVRSGDVLVSTVRPNLNTVAFVPDEMDAATASTGFCVLRPDNRRLSGRYLFHWVQSPSFVADMVKQATGQSYPAVSDKIIKQSNIPFPPLDEQKRIAAILDQANDLRRLRQRAIDRLNELGQAIFYEMFGDPATNTKGWDDRRTLGEVSEIVSGITKGRKLNGKHTREVPYLAVINVQDRELRLDPLKTIEATEDEINRYSLKKDDLLLTEGGDPDKLGRGTLWSNELSECIHQNHVFRVRLSSDDIEPLFLNWLVGSERGKRYFLRSAKQTTGIASVNMTQLRGFPLIVPPVELQYCFSERLQHLGNQLLSQYSALANTSALFSSLQHRAFHGKL